MSADAYTHAYREQGLPCFICGTPIVLRTARGRKSGRPFLSLFCPADRLHYTLFIGHAPYVREVLDRLERDTP